MSKNDQKPKVAAVQKQLHLSSNRKDPKGRHFLMFAMQDMAGVSGATMVGTKEQYQGHLATGHFFVVSL